MIPWGTAGSSIAPGLVSTVAARERDLAGSEAPWLESSGLEEALRSGSSYVAEAAERSAVTFDPTFIVSVHERLALGRTRRRRLQ